MKMTDQELAVICKQELSTAQGASGDEVSANRKQALDYYYCRPRGDEIPGRSQVISPDVSAMVEAVLSQSLDAFSGDNPAEFEPLSADDEDQAQVESDVVNQVIMQQNSGYLMWVESIKDGLLLRNGLVKTFVDETVDVTRKTYKGLSNIEVQQLLQQAKPGLTVEVVSTDEKTDTIKVKYTQTTQTLVVESVPPENFVVQADYNRHTLDKSRFCAERHYYTRSELVQMGFDKGKVADLPVSTEGLGSNARNVGAGSNDQGAWTPDQDNIECWECYLRVDVDGDGISELCRILVAGEDNSTVLEVIEVPFVPYATGSPFINPHRWIGMSLFDKIKPSQDVKTAISRQWLDNANANNNRRMVVLEGSCNMDDLLNSKPGGRIRVTQMDAVMPIEVSDIGPSCQMMLQYQDSVRSEVGGASLELASGEAQLGSQVGSQGLDRAYSVKEQLAAMICRNFAETLIRHTYLLVHQTLRLYYQMPIMAKVGETWREVSPKQWPERTRLNVKLGLSAGERARKQASLGQVLQYQMAALDKGMGGVLTDLSGVHNAIMDWGKASGLENPEQYWIDPTSEAAQQAQQSQQKQAKEQQDKQDGMVQETLDIERGKVIADKQKAAQETAWKYFNSYLDALTEEMKVTGQATVEFELAVLNAKAATIKETEGVGDTD